MSKRKLSYISSIPYSTNSGGRWLRKALDPADIDVDIMGMPDTATNPRTVLNYQMQADIPTPDTDTFIPTNTSSYDADLYLYQSPIIYGMSVSYPQGTRDISTGAIQVDFQNFTISCAAGTAPRTVNIFTNDQIEGSNYKAKLDSWTRYCQRYRMIYGGVQAIPACSALFDSGTIEATQQIFNPENTNVVDVSIDSNGANNDLYSNPGTASSSGKVYKLQSFNVNDFPDSGNAIQNPTALYCRYKEGTYMPYKIRNPLVHQYLNSEERSVINAPFIMTNIAYYVYYQGVSNGTTRGILDYDPASRTFRPSGTLVLTNLYESCQSISFYIKCYNKLGVGFWLRFSTYSTSSSTADSNLQINGQPTAFTLNLPNTLPSFNKTAPFSKTQLLYWTDPVDPTKTKTYFVETDVMNADVENNDKAYSEPTSLLPITDCNLGVINFRSIGIQASVRLIFRIGIELLITAGGVYSPFKHKAPKYDEKAINSYIKACHNMRDAFLGNAATPEGHAEYSANMNSIVSSLNNPGSGWYGRVSI